MTHLFSSWIRSHSRRLRVLATVLTSIALLTDVRAIPLSEEGGGGRPGTLSVSTEPAGADVFVDGRHVGVTPATVPSVAGPHRVRVAKAGFLENARLVEIAGARETAVRVTLTPDRTTASKAAEQVMSPASQKSGSGSKKWLWVGLAGAGGAAALLATTRANENLAPVVGSVNVVPASGLQGATVITFTAVGAHDPENAPLSLAWDFGDGTTGSGETVTHVYNTAATFNAKVTVGDGQKTASSSGAVNIVSLTGTWRGANASYTVTLTHAGSLVSGTWDDVVNGVSRRWSGTGSAVAPRNLALTLNPVLNAGTSSLSVTATLDASGTNLTGTVTGFATPFALDVRR